MMLHKTRLTLVASLLASLLMAGCEAQGDGELSDGLDNNGNTTLFPNDGMAPTQVTDNGTAIAGSFICEGGIQAVTPNATTEVGSGGLVGGPLTNLLNLVGGDTVTQLLNSVSEKDAVIDNNLATFSTYSLTLGLLAVLNSVDLIVNANTEIQPGNFAVFAVRIPPGVLDASLVNSLTVRTFLAGVQQEELVTTQSSLDLLGLNVAGADRLFVGIKAAKRFDSASLSLRPNVLSANVGDALYAHELCVRGRFVPATTP